MGLTVPVHGQVTAEDAIFDDDELAAAIDRAGNVYLPLFFSLDPPPQTGIGKRITDMLAEDFTLGAAELASRLDSDIDQIDRVLAGTKHRVASELAKRSLAEKPDLTAEEFLRTTLGASADAPGVDRDDLVRAYRREQALVQLAKRSGQKLPLQAGAPVAHELTPPLPKLLAGAQGAGYVIFERDIDGVVRRLPLVVSHRGKLLKQLGLTVACDWLGIPDDQIVVGPNQLVLHRNDDQDMYVDLDEDGQFLINWTGGAAAWTRSFTHVPVTRVLEIHANREAVQDNKKQLLFEKAEVVRLFTPTAYPDYEALVRRLSGLESEEPDSHLDATGPGQELAAVREAVAKIEDNARYILKQYYTAAQDQAPADAQERALFEAAERLYPSLAEGRLAARVKQANQRLQRRIGRRLAELRPMIKNRICLIGYTASAVADLQPMPVFGKSAPGVMVHSNVINTVLQNAFIKTAGPAANSLIILLCGCLVSFVTLVAGPRLSFLFVLFMLGAIAVINGIGLFGVQRIHVAVATPMMAVLLSWSLITMYRQLTEERTKRQVATALAQYTAPVIARRIVQDPARHDLSPVEREVTSFFSDLKGFTSISERLGPANTRALLNPYLGTMSDVLHSRSALINKFYGDGIFAFFNPPVLPSVDHARQACLAALDSVAALEQLSVRFNRHRLAEHFAQLRMRVGISTGTVYVGDFGSSNKLDYTCLGDPVNLASRLESANKAFGTTVMVSGDTRDQTADDLAFRYLADLRVIGKTQSVAVFELLGRTSTVDPKLLDYAGTFADGVKLFKDAKWQECVRHFGSLLQIRRDDLAATLYIETCQRFQQSQPPPDWAGELQLEEK
jgi:class 3 adenylate cyclase